MKSKVARKKGLMLFPSMAAAAVLSQTHFVSTSAFAPHVPLHLQRAPTLTHRGNPRCRPLADPRYPHCARSSSAVVSMTSAGKRRRLLRKFMSGAVFRQARGGLQQGVLPSSTPMPRGHTSGRSSSMEQGKAGVSLAATLGGASASAPPGERADGMLQSEDAAEPREEVGTPPLVMLAKGVANVLGRLVRFARDIPEDAADEGRFLMMATFVGVVTGTAVTAFKTLIGATKGVSYGDLLGRVPAGASSYAIAFIPVLGAVAVVSIMRVLRLKSYGPGLGGLTEEVDKQVPWSPRRTLGKTLAAVATLGTGNSLGPEGPAVEIGVASSRYASSLSKNLSVERQRMLLGAGAAAGVAAGFNAPIAGIFFALEIVKDTFSTNYNSKSFIAATLLCSVVSALIAKIGLHDELALRPAAYHLESPLVELPLYIGLGVVAGLVAVMFKYFSRKSGDVFEGNVLGFSWMKKVPQWSKPLMMAAVTGLVGVFYPQVLFFGYDTLDKLLANTGSYTVSMLGFLCVAKALLTAGALGSGLVGGTFAPSLFLGATAGAAYHRILQGSLTAFRSAAGSSLATLSTAMLPLSSRLGLGGPAGDLGSLLTIAESPAYAMVGAAAVLSALYRAPLTGSLLMFELTKDYDIVLPLMAAAGVSSLVVELFSLAESEAPAPAPMPRDMSLEIGLKISGRVDKLMGKVQVVDALVPRVLVLTADMSLPEAMSAFRLTRNEFAVVVEQPGVETPERSAAGAGQDISGGDGGEAQALLAEDMWERRDLQLVGVLALREIIRALDQERPNSASHGASSGLTAGSVCRQDCFTVKASKDIAVARSIMESKGVRFLPVVVDMPSPAAPSPPHLPASELEGLETTGTADLETHAAVPMTTLPQAVVGVLSRDSVRIASRLTEAERAIWDESMQPASPSNQAKSQES